MKSVVFSIAVLLFIGLCNVGPASGAAIAEISSLPVGTSATIGEAIIVSTTDLESDPLCKSFQLRDNTLAITVYGTNAYIDDVLTAYSLDDVVEIGGITARRGGTLIYRAAD
jgi:hypothetical protein